ncbi:MAG: ABC transporter ATP-binding protein [Longibaculum muris]|uniref:ATP-binding cassette subfamily B protein n=1 Tax=Longibaculum muris TaxID=1796628 RepID=A0A4R3Z7Z4_9FIRM|nr:ABC transporter ATP-binding protein [Longibaculum muris]KXU50703.1 ABC transporter, ATP-binding protein [Candidatus Stoquefichus sp. KLE1796]MCR1887361.1 ABC transporter ATP-binding protein/permease [Longibaculum muris]MED9812258.1 ABC transporter ATP-binding protein [Longibaculum muris]TCW02064.1 ATP-binding cassette subfamily B protein [Longibaculum muris]
MKRLLKMLWKEYKIHLIIVFLCIIANAYATVQGTLFMQTLIDHYITPLIGQPNPDFTGLFYALIRVAAFFMMGVICAYAFSRIMVNVTQGFLRHLRIELFEHMESLPIAYFDRTSHGDVMSVYTNDIDTLRQLISQSIPQLTSSCITIITVFISMLTLSITLTCISLVMLCVMVYVSRKIGSLSGHYFVKQQNDIGRVNGYIEEMISGQKVVKVFNHEEKAIEDFRNINNDLRNSAYKANKFANILMPVTIQIGNFSYIICAVIGAILSISGVVGITIGTLVSFLTLNKNFNQPIGQISQQINSVAMAQAGAKRIFDLLDQKSEDDQGIVTLCRVEYVDGQMQETLKRTGHWAWRHPRTNGEIELVEMKGDIRLENVDFGYFDDRMVLHDLNVFAAPGEKIAFVGATGAGKTTITNLINRFYDIQKGTITYDGIDIKLIKKDDLRKSLGVVLQDTHLFTGTIMDNIRYGRLDATDEECIAAASLANADTFIKHLPDGYQTMLSGDGSNLSQGQRQLLAIARAAVANPPVLILDEATSSIDSRTEKLVQDGMDKLMQGRTTLVIAHRLSTIKNSDCIMVLELGRIIESGNHQSLMKEKKKYYQLYTGAIEMD